MFFTPIGGPFVWISIWCWKPWQSCWMDRERFKLNDMTLLSLWNHAYWGGDEADGAEILDKPVKKIPPNLQNYLDYFRENFWLRFTLMGNIISRYPSFYYSINFLPRLLIALNFWVTKLFKGHQGAFNKDISMTKYDKIAGIDWEISINNPIILCAYNEYDTRHFTEIITILEQLHPESG